MFLILLLTFYVLVDFVLIAFNCFSSVSFSLIQFFSKFGSFGLIYFILNWFLLISPVNKLLKLDFSFC